MQLGRRGRSWLTQFLSPETPLFAVGLLVSAAIVGVMTVVIWATFVKGLPGMGGYLSLENYTEVLFYPLTGKAGLNTLFVGVGTVMINLFFALPMAWLIHRTNTPFKSFFLTLAFLHMLIPGFLKSMGWIILLSPKIGIINHMLRTFIPVESGPISIYNLPSIAILQGVSLTPVMFFMISGAFLAIDPAFEEAAEVTGASKLRSLRRITLPLVGPAIVAAVIYTFMTAVSMFEVAALLGASSNIHVFSTLMYSSLHPEIGLPEYGVAGVYGVILLIPTLVALFFYQRMLRLSHRYATVTGKGYKPKMVDLGGWKWAAVGFIGFFFMVDIFLPFLSMLWTSFLPRIQVPSMAALSTMSLDGYRSALVVLIKGGVLANTLTLVLTVGVAIGFISVVISWIVIKTRFKGRFAIDTIAMLPHAIPNIAVAFAIVFIALVYVKNIPLYGSLATIMIAHTMAWVGFGTRTLNAALIQIHSDLEDAVQTSGGSRMVAIRRVFIPLLAPPIAYITIWTMLHSYREVTMALFLQSPRNLVLSTAIWQRWQDMDTATAGALGVLMVVGMGVVILILQRAFPHIFMGRGRK